MSVLLHLQDDIHDQIPTEDSDAAPGWEVPLRDVKSVISVHVDVHNDLLWTGASGCATNGTKTPKGIYHNQPQSSLMVRYTLPQIMANHRPQAEPMPDCCLMLPGHSDGWVCGYALGEDPGAAVERRYCFAAFRGGSVTALCATAWGDLWAASSRGGIRQVPFRLEAIPLSKLGQNLLRHFRHGAARDDAVGQTVEPTHMAVLKFDEVHQQSCPFNRCTALSALRRQQRGQLSINTWKLQSCHA